MDIFHSIILGAVEGFTEFLPISSTGHLILASRLLGIEQTAFVKSFEIAIQLGAIGAVVVLYWRRLFVEIESLKRIIVAFIPTAVIGLAFYKIVKTYLIGNDVITLLALSLGGIALIAFELWHKPLPDAAGTISDISYKKAFWIGVCQSVAIIPGVSRSAATILGGLFANIKRETVVEFSFLLAVPTMAAATGLDLLKVGFSFTSAEVVTLLVGLVTSFVVALVSIRFLIGFIKTHTFIPFGIYRIVLALSFWIIVLRP